MNWQRRTLSLRRLRYRSRVRGTALQRCWQAPLPSSHRDWRDRAFLACDGEMSSLGADRGELLSLGWIAIDNGAIPLESAGYYLLRPNASVGQSAAIHQLRDCEFDAAKSPEEVMLRFLKAAAGRMLVFHNARLDIAFLDRLCRHLYGAPLLLPYVDTMSFEQRALARADVPVAPGDLRLHRCRERYNLPPYPSHNAQLDALATAELLLAQLAAGASV